MAAAPISLSKSQPSLPTLNRRPPPPSPSPSIAAARLASKMPSSHLFIHSPRTPTPRRRRRATHAIQSLFTGIVEEMGTVKLLGPNSAGGFDLTVAADAVLSDVRLGDSIAVNGACLTVSAFDAAAADFTVGLAPETLRRTSLAELAPGSPVNLERALLPSTRMGGHFVQGHVDGTGEIVLMMPEEDSLWVKVRTSPMILKFIVPKGFLAVDGTSLTVGKVYDDESCFDFMLVAYTQQKVVIPLKKAGQKVNLEVDILGKYVERLVSSGGFRFSSSS